MAAPDASIVEFVKRLTLGTRQGSVPWVTRDADGLWLEVEIDAGTASIRSESEDGDHPFTFELKNAKGQVLAHTTTLVGEHYVGWEQDLEALFKAAHNSALGVDEALSEFASKLDLPEAPSDIPF
jgi:hypothetical protein